MELADEAQPLLGDLGVRLVGQRLEPLEDVTEDAVEAVEMALVLDEAGA